jgi:hypothetical protein
MQWLHPANKFPFLKSLGCKRLFLFSIALILFIIMVLTQVFSGQPQGFTVNDSIASFMESIDYPASQINKPGLFLFLVQIHLQC